MSEKITNFVYFDEDGGHPLAGMSLEQLRQCVLEMALYVRELEERNVTIIADIFQATQARNFH